MSNHNSLTPIDVTAATLEKAIQEGLDRLGLSRNDVIIEIVEEGSRGVLGMGARNAVVRLTPLRPPTRRGSPVESAAVPEEPEEPEAAEAIEVPEDTVEPTPPEAPATSPVPPTDIAPSTVTPTQAGPVEEATPEVDRELPEWAVISEPEPEPEAEPEPTPEPETAPSADARPPVDFDEEVEYEAKIAQDTLGELLEHMDIDADIDVYHAKPAPHEDDAPWILDVRGNDLGILIGRHGETLNALQYITRLIVSRELQRRANIVVDVEGYKARREDSLRKLAERMAQKAVQSGRTVTLDPMPPNERRVIHVELRKDRRVETESIGSGNSRRVTIIPSDGNGS